MGKETTYELAAAWEDEELEAARLELELAAAAAVLLVGALEVKVVGAPLLRVEVYRKVPTLTLCRGSPDELCPLLSRAALSLLEPFDLFKPTPSPTPSAIARATMAPTIPATSAHRFRRHKLSCPAPSSQSSAPS